MHGFEDYGAVGDGVTDDTEPLQRAFEFRDAYDLGCAWAEAEAALPEGWRVFEVSAASRDEDGGVWLDRDLFWVASAADAPQEWIKAEAHGTGSTPADALRALAARLRERAG